ncbi:MAG: hypothetical protein AAFY26_06045 [Cyanobacteria bacterium J06638_22]
MHPAPAITANQGIGFAIAPSISSLTNGAATTTAKQLITRAAIASSVTPEQIPATRQIIFFL